MLEHQRISEQQVGRRPPRDLVVREVPRHDTQEHTERPLDHVRTVRALRREFFRREQLVGVVCVPAVDAHHDVQFGRAPRSELAHLPADVLDQPVFVLFIEIGDGAENTRALVDGGLLPAALRFGGAIEDRISI